MAFTRCPVCNKELSMPVRPSVDMFDLSGLVRNIPRRSDLKPLSDEDTAIGAPLFCESCGYADARMDAGVTGIGYALSTPADMIYLVTGDNFRERPPWFRNISPQTPTWIRWRNAAACAELGGEHALAFEAYVRASWLTPDIDTEREMRVRATMTQVTAIGETRRETDASRVRFLDAGHQYLMAEMMRHLDCLASADHHYREAEAYGASDQFAVLAAWQRAKHQDHFVSLPGEFPIESKVAGYNLKSLSPRVGYKGPPPVVICLGLGRLSNHNLFIERAYKWIRLNYGSQTRRVALFAKARELAEECQREDMPVCLVLDASHLQLSHVEMPTDLDGFPSGMGFVVLGKDSPKIARFREAGHRVEMLPPNAEPKAIWDKIVTMLPSNTSGMRKSLAAVKAWDVGRVLEYRYTVKEILSVEAATDEAFSLFFPSSEEQQYIVHDLTTDREALAIRPCGEKRRQAIADEYLLWRSLEPHAQIAELHQALDIDGDFCLFCECGVHRTLRWSREHGALKGREVPLLQVLQIAEDVAKGLQHLESQTDESVKLSPHNLLLADDGGAKLCGFEKGSWPALHTYGFLLYEMVCGFHPMFAAERDRVIAGLESEGGPRTLLVDRWLVPPKTLRPDVPKPLSDLIVKCLREPPDEHYECFKDVISDIADCRKALPKAKG